MKIVHVIDSLEVGGAEVMVVALANLQRSRGHGVAIACLFREGALVVSARAAGIEVMDFEKRIGMDFGALLRLRRWLRVIRPDVLHTHNPVAHYYAVAAAMGLGIRQVINTRHNMGLGGVRSRREVLFRLAMRFTDHAVAVCETARTRLLERGMAVKHKTVTIPNGIELSRQMQRNEIAKNALLDSLAVRANTFVFGSVGRISVVKDQVTMLRAFRQLLHQLTNVVGVTTPSPILVIAGDGEQRDALERERALLDLDENVFLLGQRDDIPQLLAGFDAFVLSSRSEGYSLALVEAAATALPIVATDVGGNAEIVQNGINGLLVPPGSPDALAEAMQRLFENEEERARMGTAGRHWARENGSIESMYERYLALYRGGHAEAAMSAAGRQT